MKLFVASAAAVLLTGSGTAPTASTPVAGASSSQARVVDATYSCAVRGVGSPDTVRYLSFLGEPRIARYAPWAHLEGTDGAPSPTGVPPARDSIGAGFRTGRTQHWAGGATWLNVATCTPTRARVALTTKGLRGGAIAQFGEAHKCDVPARVLLRVRAVFRRPVTLQQDRRARYHLTASGRIASATLIVRASGGAPIGYAAVDDSTGRTQIFTSPSRCFPA